jgi:hypothetical protein
MKRSSLSILVLVLLALSACQPSAVPPTETSQQSVSTSIATDIPAPTETLTPTPTETPVLPTETPSATPIPPPVGPSNFPSGVNPLTGLKVSNPELLERRPVAVKIQMFPRNGRPPWGISQADIVFDFIQNGGLTRFNAIFYGKDAEQVGPIRSARLFDRNILEGYKTILTFGGAFSAVMDHLYSSPQWEYLVMEGSQNCPPMCRIEPEGNNYLVADTPGLHEYIQSKDLVDERQNLDGMTFDARVPEGGEPGTELSIRYSISAYTRWDYDPASGSYLRFQDAQEDEGAGEVLEPLTDRLNGQQVSAENVVVLFLGHNIDPPYSPNVMMIGMFGEGDAIAFRDGQAYRLRWMRPTSDSVVYLEYPDGTAFPYKPGVTWYQVVGTSSEVIQGDVGAWRILAYIP